MSRAAAAGLLLLLTAAPAQGAEGGWRSIFNGRDLTGWTPKINHHAAGENWRDTFRVEDGVLKVSYAGYDRFADEFGHLVWRERLSHYRLRLEYRFTGPPGPGTPAWASRNSGVMLHGQAAADMALNQSFPISVEAQLLGAQPGPTRATGNLCTPGVRVRIDGRPMPEHCWNSALPAFPDGEWVRFEVEVRGASIRHFVNGKEVLAYDDVRIAPDEFKRWADIEPGSAVEAPLTSGYISLQAEGGPVEFRRIEIMELKR